MVEEKTTAQSIDCSQDECVMLSDVTLCTNLWNLSSFKGKISIGKVGKSINTSVDIHDIKTKRNTIFAYPEVMLGRNLVGREVNTLSKPKIIFPIKVETLLSKDFYLDMGFKINKTTIEEMPFNISFDFWLKQDPNSDDMPKNGDIEVMIWMYRHLQKPIGVSERLAIIKSNSDRDSKTKWEIYEGTGNVWETISFIIDNKSQKRHNVFHINLKDFLNAVAAVSHNKISELYLMGIELGSEFGTPELKVAQIDWDITSYSASYENKSLRIL